MALPPSPHSQLWRWEIQKYLAGLSGGGGGGAGLTVSDTPPGGATPGQLWWETDTGNLYVWYDDGSSQQWVQINIPNVADTAPPLPNSDLCINGAMQVNQWYNVDTYYANGNNAWFYPLDQWTCLSNHIANTAVWRFRYTTGAVLPVPGFGYALNWQATTANALAGATDLVAVFQHIEGYQWAKMGWGFAAAQPITISFWVWATVAGTMAVTAKQSTGVRSYSTSVPVSAGTWEYKSVTIPGDTAGSYPADNASCVLLGFAFGSGTTYKGPPDQWNAAGNYFANTATTNFFGTANNQIYLTGVTFMPGSTGPTAAMSPQMMRRFDDDLILSKRYFQKTFPYGVVPAGGAGNTGSISASSGVFNSSTASVLRWNLPVQMRAVPAIGLYTPAGGVAGCIGDMFGSAVSQNPTSVYASHSSVTVYSTATASFTPCINATASARM